MLSLGLCALVGVFRIVASLSGFRAAPDSITAAAPRYMRHTLQLLHFTACILGVCLCVCVCVLLHAAWNPFFNGKAALEAKRVEAARISQEVVEDLLERTRKVCDWGGIVCV